MPEDDDIDVGEDDLEDGDELAVWQFKANPGACELCVALDDSTWTDAPSLPHDKCECDLVALEPGATQETDCGDNSWQWEEVGSNVMESRPWPGHYFSDDHMEWEIVIVVTCWNGEEHLSETITVDMGWSSDESEGEFVDWMFDHVFDQAFDQAEDLMASLCPPCNREAPLIV